MQKVFITGASGFLGRYLLKFAPEDARILAQYRSNALNDQRKNVSPIQLDLAEPRWDDILQFRPQVIIHAAAQASVDECELNPEMAWRINFEATRQLVELAKQLNSRFIYLSSDLVFDGKKGDYREEDQPSPLNVYASTKVASEEYVLEQLPDSGVVIRPALFYGLSLNGRPSFTEIMLKNLRSGKKVFLFTDQFRTPILVSTLATAIWELTRLDYRGILHIGGSQKLSRYEMGKIMCELFKLPQDLIVPIQAREAKQVAPRPLDCSLDSSRAQKLLSTPLVDYRYGLYLAFQ